MGKVIAIANQKGGVGKTTAVMNLGVSLAQLGKRLCLVDSDPQASLTQACGMNPLQFETNILTCFGNDPTAIVDAVYSLGVDNLSLDIIPSSPMLSGVELSLVQARNRERKLEKALKYIKDAYDYILIDCQPALSLLTINSLTVADFIIIPAETSRLSHFAMELFTTTVEDIHSELNENLEILGVIATMYDGRATEDREVLAELSENYNLLGIIKRTTIAKKFVKSGSCAVLGMPNSAISIEYKKIAKTIIEKAGV